MMLVEQAPVDLSALPLAEFRDHLKLGRGFSDDDAQDSVLEAVLRSALATTEAQISKAVFKRGFHWKLASWRGFRREELPIAPVSVIQELRVRESDGTASVVPASHYRLEEDAHKPCLVAIGTGLPTVPVGGGIEVDFEAGYAPDWAGVPADLARAVLLLAAHFHENRHAQVDRGESVMPFGVTSLLAPYRTMRLFGWRL